MINLTKTGQLQCNEIKEKTSTDTNPNQASLAKNGTAAAVEFYEY